MKRKSYLLILIISAIGCRKPYNPPVITGVTNYLVVEGVINTGPDSTIIKLSRTVNISAGTTINPETGAVITVEKATPMEAIRLRRQRPVIIQRP